MPHKQIFKVANLDIGNYCHPSISTLGDDCSTNLQARIGDAGESDDQKEVQWEEQLTTAEKPQMERIIEQRVGKKTNRKTYLEYLVKWKDHSIDAGASPSKSKKQAWRQRYDISA
jgi:hypothetical protein